MVKSMIVSVFMPNFAHYYIITQYQRHYDNTFREESNP